MLTIKVYPTARLEPPHMFVLQRLIATISLVRLTLDNDQAEPFHVTVQVATWESAQFEPGPAGYQCAVMSQSVAPLGMTDEL